MRNALSCGVALWRTRCRDLASPQAAKKIRSLEIDIAVDLTGYTRNSRRDILSHRPAPIQAHFLGYPGTLQTTFVDYMFVDEMIVPPENQAHYSEKLVYLPDCYQVSDDKRQVAEHTPSRKELGLPDNSFVFCCFNNGYKFTPHFFEKWMRLLHAIPESVLCRVCADALSHANWPRANTELANARPRFVLVIRPICPQLHQRGHCACRSEAIGNSGHSRIRIAPTGEHKRRPLVFSGYCWFIAYQATDESHAIPCRSAARSWRA